MRAIHTLTEYKTYLVVRIFYQGAAIINVSKKYSGKINIFTVVLIWKFAVVGDSLTKERSKPS